MFGMILTKNRQMGYLVMRNGNYELNYNIKMVMSLFCEKYGYSKDKKEIHGMRFTQMRTENNLNFFSYVYSAIIWWALIFFWLIDIVSKLTLISLSETFDWFIQFTNNHRKTHECDNEISKAIKICHAIKIRYSSERHVFTNQIVSA